MLKGKDLFNSLLTNSIKLDSYLSKAISTAYKNRILISNPVLSRNPFFSSLLLSISRNENGSQFTIRARTVLSSIIKYYFMSAVHLLFFVFHYILFKVSHLEFKYELIDRHKDLIVVDTFTLIDQIYSRGGFEDYYFGSLYSIMSKRGRQFVVLCLLFGDKPWNIKRRIQTYNILAKDERNFVTEFELMGYAEWIELIKFILVYPFAALKLTKENFGEFDALFRREIIKTLSSVQFPYYVKYLVGSKLRSLCEKKIHLISWYENQVIDKLLCRGLRDSGIESLIYGCQFFLKSPLLTNLYPIKAEGIHNVLPDLIYCTGSAYVNEGESVVAQVGIAPRYDYLFDIVVDEKSIADRREMLVLLTYDIDESNKIIELVEKSVEQDFFVDIRVKSHPNHEFRQPFKYPKGWKSTNRHLGVVCPEAACVITGGSGSALEAAVMGCSVIVVGKENGLTYNPMPEYGKGKIWELVFDSDEFREAFGHLSAFRCDNPYEIRSMAEELRHRFFTRTTEKKYIELFNL